MIVRDRALFRMSNKRLMRARRLYGFLISKEVNRNPRIVLRLADRAIERGLYSQATIKRDVVFSLCRHCYRHSKNFDRQGGFGWYEWMRENGVHW